MFVTLSWLYGILSIASAFITGGMYRMGRQRLRELNREKPDVYFYIVLFAGLHGLAGLIWWSLRGWDAIVNHRLNVGSTPLAFVCTAGLYAVGKGGLVFASSLNGKPFVWRAFLTVCVAWSGVVWWSVIDPAML